MFIEYTKQQVPLSAIGLEQPAFIRPADNCLYLRIGIYDGTHVGLDSGLMDDLVNAASASDSIPCISVGTMMLNWFPSSEVVTKVNSRLQIV